MVPRYWRSVVPEGFECLLLNPFYNAAVTAYILRTLYKRYPNSLLKIVASYNSGDVSRDSAHVRKRAYRYALRVLRAYAVLKEARNADKKRARRAGNGTKRRIAGRSGCFNCYAGNRKCRD